MGKFKVYKYKTLWKNAENQRVMLELQGYKVLQIRYLDYILLPKFLSMIFFIMRISGSPE